MPDYGAIINWVKDRFDTLVSGGPTSTNLYTQASTSGNPGATVQNAQNTQAVNAAGYTAPSVSPPAINDVKPVTSPALAPQPATAPTVPVATKPATNPTAFGGESLPGAISNYFANTLFGNQQMRDTAKAVNAPPDIVVPPGINTTKTASAASVPNPVVQNALQPIETMYGGNGTKPAPRDYNDNVKNGVTPAPQDVMRPADLYTVWKSLSGVDPTKMNPIQKNMWEGIKNLQFDANGNRLPDKGGTTPKTVVAPAVANAVVQSVAGGNVSNNKFTGGGGEWHMTPETIKEINRQADIREMQRLMTTPVGYSKTPHIDPRSGKVYWASTPVMPHISHDPAGAREVADTNAEAHKVAALYGMQGHIGAAKEHTEGVKLSQATEQQKALLAALGLLTGHKEKDLMGNETSVHDTSPAVVNRTLNAIKAIQTGVPMDVPQVQIQPLTQKEFMARAKSKGLSPSKQDIENFRKQGYIKD